MKIQLSDHFGYTRLIRFTIPSIVMMIFTSIYGMVDGYFVSNCVGKTEFAALNLIWPFPMILGAIGFMIGSGGTALISKTLGEGDKARANGLFSMLVYFALGIGIILDIIGMSVMRPVARLLGASGEMLEFAVAYGNIIMAFMPTFMLQVSFQSFMIAAEKPTLGLIVTLVSGFTNIILDWLLIGVLGYGLEAAAIATVASQIVGSVWPLIYFSVRNSSLLRLGRPIIDFKALAKTCTNGISELISNLAVSLMSMVYNLQLIRICGEDGVAAFGVIMYVAILYLAVYFGYTMGVMPVIAYHYGAGNKKELHNLTRRRLILLSCAAIVLTSAAILMSGWIARIFTGYDEALCKMSERAFALYSVGFLGSWFNVFASSFFTALNDGKTSGIISFSRMFGFQLIAVLLLPLILGLDGVWLAMPAAELCSAIVSATFLIRNKKVYGY